jgi:hypothetical protein
MVNLVCSKKGRFKGLRIRDVDGRRNCDLKIGAIADEFEES